MQSSSFQSEQYMTETISYLSNHPKSRLQHWRSNQLWLRPSITDRPFSEAGHFSEPSYPVLARFDSLFPCVLLIHFWIPCTLSVVEAWAFLCPKASFTKKKTNSKCSVFLAQHSLRNRSVLPRAIVSHVNRTLSYLDAIFYSSLKRLKITYLCRI